MIRNEYWITPDGHHAVEPEGGHEREVIETAGRKILDILEANTNNEFVEDDDLNEAYLNYLNEHEITPATHSKDWADQVIAIHPQADELRSLMHAQAGYDSGDARDFAMKEWGWIKVAGAHVTVWTLNSGVAKRLRDALLDILFEEGCEDEFQAGSTRFTLYVVTGRNLQITVDQLLEPEIWATSRSDLENEAATRVAAAQVRQADAALIPAYYAGRVGD